MSICERLFSVMEKTGYTQKALSEALNVPSNTVANWKIRKSDPPAKYIVPICDFLGISLEELLTGKESKYANPSEISEDALEIAREYDKLDQRSKAIIKGKIYERVDHLAQDVQVQASSNMVG